MLCEAGKGIYPHCGKADVLPWEWGKGVGTQDQLLLQHQGIGCVTRKRNAGWLAVGSGDQPSGKLHLTIRRIVSGSPVFVLAGNCTFCVQSWKGSSSMSMDPWIPSVGCQAGELLKFSALSCSSYLLTCLQQTDNFVALKRITILGAI